MRGLFFLMAVLPLSLLSGCSGIGSLTTTTGVKTTTEYDSAGHMVRQVQEEKPLLDSQTAYQETVQKVAEEHTKAVQAVSTGLQQSMTSIASDKKISSDARALMLYRGFESFEALGKMANVDPKTLAAIQRSMSGYEVLSNLGGKIISGGMWAYLGHAAAQTVQGALDAAGDKTEVHVGGDNNAVSLDKRSINTEIHANTTGQNSPTTVSSDPSTGCESGNCGQPEEGSAGTQEFNLDSCVASPPAGRNSNGDAMWDGSCSCRSHAAGKC